MLCELYQEEKLCESLGYNPYKLCEKLGALCGKKLQPEMAALRTSARHDRRIGRLKTETETENLNYSLPHSEGMLCGLYQEEKLCESLGYNPFKLREKLGALCGKKL